LRHPRASASPIGQTPDRFRSGARMAAQCHPRTLSKPLGVMAAKGGLGERSPPVGVAEPPGVSAAREPPRAMERRAAFFCE